MSNKRRARPWAGAKYYNIAPAKRLMKGVSYQNQAKTLTIDIDDVIDDWWGFSASTLKRTIDSFDGKVEGITVNLYSPGGSVFEGFEIYNILKDHSARVEVNVGALAASIATVIMMSGDVIRVHNNSTGMIHNPWVIIAGESEDLRRRADDLDKMKRQIINTYVERTGINTERVSELMDEVTYMDADEMLELGFADEIIGGDSDEKDFIMDSQYKNFFTDAPQPIANRIAFVNRERKQKTNKPAPAQAVAIVPLIKEEGPPMDPANQIQQPAPTAAPVNQEPQIDAVAIQKKERERIESIRATGNKLGVSDAIVTKLIDEGTALDVAYPQLVNAMQPGDPVTAPAGTVLNSNVPTITFGRDESDAFTNSVVNAFSIVGDLPVDAKTRQEVNSQDVPRDITSLARTLAFNAGARNTGAWDREQCADFILGSFRNDMGSLTSTTLSNIFADTMNKGFGVGQGTTRTTYREWTRSMSVNDFRDFSLLTASTFSDLQEMPEGAPFTKGKIADKKEVGSVKTYGKGASLTRQAMINDDMQVLTRVPVLMGGAWERLKNRKVYDLLTSNTYVGPTMNEDSTALFDAATHGNYVALGGGAAPTTILINTGITAMMTQKMLLPSDNETSNGEATNIVPAKIIIPPALRQGTLELVKSPFKSDITTRDGVYNTVDFMEIVVDAYLSLATGWYLAANPNEIDTFVLLNLNGREAPFVNSAEATVGDALGINYTIHGEFGVMAGDWRGLYFNAGA